MNSNVTLTVYENPVLDSLLIATEIETLSREIWVKYP